MNQSRPPQIVTDELIAAYRHDGFVKVPQIITTDEARTFHAAALEADTRRPDPEKDTRLFNQNVNVWRHDPVLRGLTLHPRVAQAAAELAGVPLRLWHDHVLIKLPHNQAATEYHQDQPYWPHQPATSAHSLSCWIALGDVPVERGCMSFVKGSHCRRNLPMQNIMDKRSLFAICPDLAWDERVTVPLQAGDCTFHHGRTAHYAGANETDEHRVAIAIIFMDQTTAYRDWPHVVTDPLERKFAVGERIEHPIFPTVEAIVAGQVPAHLTA